MSRNGIVLVASISIVSEDKVLIIKERQPTKGAKWNFPSGRIEYGEDILNAAMREGKEETGLETKLVGSTGVYNFISSTNNHVILFHFVGEVAGGSLKLEDGIIDSRWIKVHDLAEFENENLREPMVLKQIIDNLLKEKLLPISMFNEQLVGSAT